ncbi:EAL domain-containing protein [Butyrivibrio sp. INlla14]|uniref:EAL domain-containing protein n=1 Tax=Butyrivibrio sp. INlla14 TaxID=1520808 RepID=UPI0008770CB6|nr:EAL domain-containing protein [Butyrivibrio sp. INlla14]SCY20783.1 EAL domain, c-di-GMP-specific phosphodiesterase class I (or its enzymatically inactive variant) [Butyrivibrio sp. INlla14]
MEEIFFIPYNYIGEIAGLVMGCLILLIMLYTSPKKTFVYKYVFRGTILSIVSILVHISILFVANNPDEYYNSFLFIFQLLLFLVLYNGILYFIFSYVNMMSIVRRRQRKEFLLMYSLLSAIYFIGVIVEIAATRLYSLELGGIDITHFVRFYSAAGIVCAIVCMNATISNRPNVARIIWYCVVTLVPVEIVLLASQILSVGLFHTVYSALSYVPVFTLGYILFHSNPYDEATGSQNEYGLVAYLDKHIGKRKMYICYVDLKYPNVGIFGDWVDDLFLKGLAICRAMEAIKPAFKIFRVSESKYVNLIEARDEKQFLSVINSIRGVLDGAKADAYVPFNYVIVSGEVPEDIGNPTKCRQFFEFVSRRFKDQNSSHFYVIKPIDYDDFLENYEISVALEDIRNRLDLEDERVLVYAQPIYSVETGSFRVAEALTRLKIGNQIISPDKFIPIAEASGTIHAITCIVLDKVCKAVESFSDYYDFDAISINISSREISQDNVNDDLMEIIEKYDFDISKIRFEITESAMFENFDRANDNMHLLTNSGIQFYLDDFGTGYSSFERVMNCPVKTIKFDKALLYKSLDDNRMDDIMSYMIEVFKKNGFVTLIEGVEDESQSQYSMERGFDYIQGYHYAKPEPIENMKKYFSRKNKY